MNSVVKESQVRKVAKTLLSEHGCSLDCYKNDINDFAYSDLLSIYSSNTLIIGCTLRQIADELKKIGDEQPDSEPPKYKIVFSTPNVCDSYELIGHDNDNEIELKNALVDVYDSWMESYVEDYVSRSGGYDRKEFYDRWNYMVDNCFACVHQYDASTCSYDEFMALSDDEFKKIGWEVIE